MKEININIEGYNVNGICVGCLNYNRKMYYRDEVKECFKLLANIDVPDGLTIQVCWECLAYVRNVMRFQDQILKAYDILYNYSRKHTFLNSPNDFIKHAPDRLKICVEAETDSCPVYRDDQEPQVKVESELKNEVEIDIVKSEPENYYDQFNEDVPNLDHNTTSDDDIQLSKLKKKKEKKKKRSKKDKKRSSEKLEKSQERGSGKLKNLPPDLVELYTMPEEEMWQIRKEDVSHKEFVKLKYKCDECIIGFHVEKLMTDHMKGRHRKKSDESYQCDVCKVYFLTKDHVSAHRSLHLRAYRCKECGVRTTLKRLMMKHVTVHKNMLQDSYKCTLCDDVFSSKWKLGYHRSICHQEKPQCDCCGKVFANKMTLKYHLKILPLNKNEKPPEKLYIPCKGCDKVFYSKKSYRAHVVIHDGLTYPCPICGKLFQWKRNLARHTRNHRDRDAGALHECRECGKTFASKDCYNNHMKMSKKHVGEKAYIHECNYCGKKFATKWCMVDHIDWDHLKRIKYQCSVCFKAFKTAKIMVAHMHNIHGGKKNIEPDGEEHLCEICGKSYKTEKRLKGHVWAMHTNRSTTKVFKCKLCPATFTWQTSIYKHMKMMHDISKKTKPLRTVNVKPKPEPYPGIELANRMYFQQNIASNLVQNIVHPIQPPPVGIVQNIG